jgi:cephalosporin hydroxylase
MNDLEKYFYNNYGAIIYKWSHYFDIYDRHFSKFRGKDITLLEIGVLEGGSLLMWKNYFGDKAKIYGLDINPACANKVKADNVEIIIGSQSDRNFLRLLAQKLPKIDILIDDGGHLMNQQIITFEELFPHVVDGGVYLCEDLHTSYMKQWGGGYKNPDTFIEYSKNFIDQLNAYIPDNPDLPVTEFTRHVDSVHYYDSILVIEKKLREKPEDIVTGVHQD